MRAALLILPQLVDVLDAAGGFENKGFENQG